MGTKILKAAAAAGVVLAAAGLIFAVSAWTQIVNSPQKTPGANRATPFAGTGEKTAAITPVNTLTGELAAEPNPVGASGVVTFFREGKRIESGSLAIYDAADNVVRKIPLRDNAAGTQTKRAVGSWDLTDKNGRPAPEGSYLVMGVIKTDDRRKEKVSLLVGVR